MRLKTHMLMKWKSCEKSWMVSAALTRHRRSRAMVLVRMDSTCRGGEEGRVRERVRPEMGV